MCLLALAVLLFAAPEKVFPAITKGSEKALTLTLQMAAVYAVWLGFLNLIKDMGLDKKIAKLLRPAIRFLFGDISDEAAGFISVNLSANMLGMGGAATPMGIAAIESLEKRENSFDAVTMLFVLNASCLQLLPTSVISLRAGFGSNAPGDIILPSFLASLVCTLSGILLVKLFSKIKLKRRKAAGAKLKGGKAA